VRREDLGSLAMFLAVADERSFTRAAAKLGVRIAASKHAARTVLWPAIDKLTGEYPDIEIELNVDDGFTDIVAGRFDAGVRLGERIDKDMIAVPIGPRLRMAAVAAPAYFAGRGIPETPHQLGPHNCINLRLMTAGGLYIWEFDQDGREIRVRVEGQLVFNDVDLVVDAAVAGHGIAFVMEDRVARHLADGTLRRVLDDWCEPFDGYYLYYPSRRQPSRAFGLVLEALRYRG
jgi:DNA-binding transcriptional LysR family regulator